MKPLAVLFWLSAATLLAAAFSLHSAATREPTLFEAVVVGIGPACGDLTGLPPWEGRALLPGLYDGRRIVFRPEVVMATEAPLAAAWYAPGGERGGHALLDADDATNLWTEHLGDMQRGSIVVAFSLPGPVAHETWDHLAKTFSARGAELFPARPDGTSWVALWQRDDRSWHLVGEARARAASTFLAHSLDLARPRLGTPRRIDL